ncbi:MAG TPA: mechanosensitive ion channel domain-containing protein [Candidatus Limnocylindria bacterium]|nr:mechanosensitive ion channel domain-containing protein [Candidatus Limnocylindria bacterium]
MDKPANSYLIELERLLQHPLLRLGDTQFTLFLLLKIAFWLTMVLLVSSLIRRLVVQRALSHTRLDAPLQYAVSKIAGYLLIMLGFYVALQVNGVDLSSLAVIAGAVGVGLGFGLQNIISNFVSGLIILAERPIAIGDRVEVAGVAGTVTSINLRSTTVVTNDNIAIIVPNSDFISHPVTNWSHGDARVQFRLAVGVAYGTDVEQLRRVLLEVAAENPRVLTDPAPSVYFQGFGESSLDFELGVWTSEMTHKPRKFRSELYFAMEKKLREHRIEIPFPQRDLHLKSGSFPVAPT